MSLGVTTFIAPVTPLTADVKIDIRKVGPLCRLLRSRGADGFYVGGGTGEGMLLTVSQRMQLLEAWRESAGPLVPLFAHVGCVSLSDCQTLARHAAECGAAGISAMGPTVFTPRDSGDLVRFLAGIAEAAPGTPFFYYLNSTMAGGLKISGYDFLTAARSALPTLEGIKFTHEDLMDLNRCLRFDGGRYRIFYGKDEFLLGAYAVGATDFIGGAFNVISPLVRSALCACEVGNMDDARIIYARLVDVVAVLRRFGGLTAVKAAMELLGVPCGPLVQPLRTISDVDKSALFATLRHVWPDVDAAVTSSTLVEAMA